MTGKTGDVPSTVNTGNDRITRAAHATNNGNDTGAGHDNGRTTVNTQKTGDVTKIVVGENVGEPQQFFKEKVVK